MRSGLMVKRAFDVAASLGGLVVLSPVLATCAVANAALLGRPVLFHQERAGLHGKPFMMVKFRSMTDERDAEGNLKPAKERLTPWGRFIRATSIDELPELWNVLKGDMSVVGPRPLYTEYLNHYSAHQARRHEMRPGITGLAQVSGRNHLSWEEKFDLDVSYIDRWSLALDIKILAKTVVAVVKREGIDAKESAPLQRFRGSPSAQKESA